MEISKIKEILNKPIYFSLNKRHLSIFLKQFAVLLTSGITPDQAIYILKDQREIKSLNYSLNIIYNDLNNGDYLSLAFSKHKIFDDFLITMIKTGEESGKLSTVCDKLAEYYEKEDEISKKIRGALTYPLILFITSIIVLFFVFKYVMPTFTALFESSNMALPFLTKLLIKISEFINKNFIIIIIVAVLTIILFIVGLRKNKAFKKRIDYIKIKFPIIGKNYIKILTGRIARALSISYLSGVDFIESLEIISLGTDNLYLQEKLENAIYEIKQGTSINEAFNNTNILPQLFNSMIEVGEETGQLGEILEIISKYYKNESDYAIDSLLRIFEPIVIIVMALFVGAIVISIAVPMFDIINNYNY
ncbi:type II secretion system F family protein [Miniphocaeibacter halophilus]|uniref:Type II secretion system F family protein n=1 Tax=Miniphocaeibacter halophilus TaxID=2931922 RepID=A0AC61MT00_9FIRM|nr:type II secretion system F family protein [Miniphocaeibacter halophilus]QQK08627.1 type II secretion system F family protein [Miniphocaeibacter halophilus]